MILQQARHKPGCEAAPAVIISDRFDQTGFVSNKSDLLMWCLHTSQLSILLIGIRQKYKNKLLDKTISTQGPLTGSLWSFQPYRPVLKAFPFPLAPLGLLVGVALKVESSRTSRYVGCELR